mmetsp:Transcript_7508/g.10747  ORF Transcript_7508/g.10747 Transcript_7508/m.10747 type:complete len:110 (-) Transcript_7508:133-462(-)
MIAQKPRGIIGMEDIPGNSSGRSILLSHATNPKKTKLVKSKIMPVAVTGDKTFKFGNKERSEMGNRKAVMTTRTEHDGEIVFCRTEEIFSPKKQKNTVQTDNCRAHTHR